MGTFTPTGGGGHGYDLTLIQAEVLDELVLAEDRRLGYAEARRNVVTRGIDLNALVGRRFRVGEAECFGQRLCEPCSHLERLTTKGVLRGLIHRGGLRADILTDGRIGVGAAIESLKRTVGVWRIVRRTHPYGVIGGSLLGGTIPQRAVSPARRSEAGGNSD